ncbi:MAG: PD-(D/E)XK nuclease family protein [Oscillospiraceae bacterium]|nr:PD-(D/E)XK nuclease family protein [Oscillospiraceae bacterium]
MLNLLLGRAGTGKTKKIMDDIKRRMSDGEAGMLLIVPEQYSHDAERQLCSVCGDALSLHAEVLSFTRLCDFVFSETGSSGGKILDKSGQILVMHKAVELTAPNLKVFGVRKMRTQMLEMLIDTVKEFKSLCITADKLEKIASNTQNPLSDKLSDIALIIDAYDALLKTYGADVAERLSLLAGHIADSSVGETGHIYFDGFNDFTAQEKKIIEELLKKGAEITICLTCDVDERGSEYNSKEIFEIPRRTIAGLRKLPGVKISITTADTKLMSEDMKHLEKHLFDDVPLRYEGSSNAVEIYDAPSRYTECEYAAAKIWELIKSGYRWRDISVMARNWGEYELTCESVFEKYGIPYFSSGKADIINKPPIALIDAALEIAAGSWEYKSVFKYIKTGLLKLSLQDISMLENYVQTWNIRGSLWQREWTMPPSGYKPVAKSSKEYSKNEEQLKHINQLRQLITMPIIKLREGIKGETDINSKLQALYSFITEISLPERLLEKAESFRKNENLRLADEYTQLQSITVDAIDQMYMILGESKVSEAEFRKLVALVLSQYDVGVIPISLDRTPIGGMLMSRRRDLKCLIILGATDENLPTLTQEGRVLSDNERVILSKLDTNISAGIEERLYREMNMLYQTLTLPTDKLIMMYPSVAGSRPSFLIKRLKDMFGISEKTLTEAEYKSTAEAPYLELRNRSMYQNEEPCRENLTKKAAEMLYGADMTLSATQVNRYYSCPYKHFMQNGLRLEPKTQAEFDAASAGNFMHFVLDGVFNEIKAGRGFKTADDALCEELTAKYTDRFVSEKLFNFEGKNTRFEYLFRRYEQSVKYVVNDMINEIKSSDFEPLEFEMDLSQLSSAQRGFIDRADAYAHNNKLYMRVIDYKTRKKAYAFDLGDILNGRDMQLLIYLFALQKYGKNKLNMDIEPAGVLYVPARDVIINAARNADDDEINKKRLGEMRRSGLIVDNPVIIEAMENGENKRYLPVSTAKDGTLMGESIISDQQIKLLSKHVDTMMERAKKEILGGANGCKPYYKSATDNACTYCEYFAVCGFDEQAGDRRLYQGKIKAAAAWEKLEKAPK